MIEKSIKISVDSAELDVAIKSETTCRTFKGSEQTEGVERYGK